MVLEADTGGRVMTIHQLARKVKSLYFRQRLLENYQTLEQEVREAVITMNIKCVNGFLIEIEAGKVRLIRLTIPDVDQPDLFEDYLKSIKTEGGGL